MSDSKRYVDLAKAPVCLHVLGQDLVNAMFAELKQVEKKRIELEGLLRKALEASQPGGIHPLWVGWDEIRAAI